MILRTAFHRLMFAASVAAQEPTVTWTTPIKDGLYLLKGRGGTVVASTGGDGVPMVDDDFEQLPAGLPGRAQGTGCGRRALCRQHLRHTATA